MEDYNYQSTPYFTYNNETSTAPLPGEQNKMQGIDTRSCIEKYIDSLQKPVSPVIELNPISTLPKKEEQNLMQPDFEWRIARRKYLDELKKNQIGLPNPSQYISNLSPFYQPNIPLHPGPLIFENKYVEESNLDNLEQIF